MCAIWMNRFIFVIRLILWLSRHNCKPIAKLFVGSGSSCIPSKLPRDGDTSQVPLALLFAASNKCAILVLKGYDPQRGMRLPTSFSPSIKMTIESVLYNAGFGFLQWVSSRLGFGRISPPTPSSLDLNRFVGCSSNRSPGRQKRPASADLLIASKRIALIWPIKAGFA